MPRRPLASWGGALSLPWIHVLPPLASDKSGRQCIAALVWLGFLTCQAPSDVLNSDAWTHVYSHTFLGAAAARGPDDESQARIWRTRKLPPKKEVDIDRGAFGTGEENRWRAAYADPRSPIRYCRPEPSGSHNPLRGKDLRRESSARSAIAPTTARELGMLSFWSALGPSGGGRWLLTLLGLACGLLLRRRGR